MASIGLELHDKSKDTANKGSSQQTQWRCYVALLVVVLSLAACSQPPAAEAVDALKILVDEDGFYRIPWRDLQDAGLTAEQPAAATLALSAAGQSVPFFLVDGNLIFYGQAPTSRYTGVRPYILRVGQVGEVMSHEARLNEAARPLSEVSQRLIQEENLVYVSQARRGDDDEPWYWQTIQIGAQATVSFELPAVGSGSGHLRARFWGSSHAAQIEPDHDLVVLVNGREVATITWDGETEHVAEISLPTGTLRAGANEIIFDNSAAGAAFVDISQLDWIELTYSRPAEVADDRLTLAGAEGMVSVTGLSGEPHVYDVSDPWRPVQWTGWRYADDVLELAVDRETTAMVIGPEGYRQPAAIQPLRTSDWRSSDHQADLIIVATDSLISPLEPLVEARQADGLNVAVVAVEELYDTFGEGEATPDSIHNFVTYAYENWQEPRPRYLLLVGDATRDYRGYVDPLPANHIPAYMVPVSYSGETVSDVRLADVDGDGWAELAVGRWPVADAGQLRKLVERTLAYEAGTASEQTLFAADATSVEFTSLTRRLLEQSGLPEQHAAILEGGPADAVTRLWNEGAWLVTYTGHGSLDMWGKDALFTSEAVDGLTGEKTPPIVLQLTCLTGLFAHPSQQSLAEAMLLSDEGPVLSIAATSLTISSHQEPFARAFLTALQDPAVARIGDALQQAKAGLDLSNSGVREVSDTFGLLGDPSARIIRPGD